MKFLHQKWRPLKRKNVKFLISGTQQYHYSIAIISCCKDNPSCNNPIPQGRGQLGPSSDFWTYFRILALLDVDVDIGRDLVLDSWHSLQLTLSLQNRYTPPEFWPRWYLRPIFGWQQDIYDVRKQRPTGMDSASSCPERNLTEINFGGWVVLVQDGECEVTDNKRGQVFVLTSQENWNRGQTEEKEKPRFEGWHPCHLFRIAL